MFDKLIGQQAIKKKLDFYVQGHRKTGVTPFLMFNGAKGLGKTHFGRSFSHELKTADGKRKPFVELNCSAIKSLNQWLEDFYLHHAVDREITILFDEAHELPKKMAGAFLTVLNTEKNTKRWLRVEQGEVPFDFKQLSFIFATTELDQLFPPLLSRLTRLDFAPYSEAELGEILCLNAEDMDVHPKALEQMQATLRGNAREAVKLAQEVERWGEINGKRKFGPTAWKQLSDQLSIRPLGLNDTEIQVLRTLSERGACSLQELANVTGLSRSAVQREAENFPLAKGLMKIDGQRKITQEGRKLLKTLG